MDLRLSLIKDASGALDPAWVGGLARALGLRGFIETGTYLGQSLENVCALFDRAVSIELSTQLYDAACRKFADRPHVKLLQGDSARRIVDAAELCAGLPTLYWLDAHWSAGNTARGDENTPILKELALVAQRARSDDVVLIDDIRYFVTIPPGFATHESNGGYPLIEQVLQVLTQFPAGGFEAVLLGDVLACVSRERLRQLRVTPAVQAVTSLRIEPDLSPAQREACERRVAEAPAPERDVLLMLPKHYAPSLQFGIGGEFCYWSGLVKEADRDYEGARADFELARRCHVHVPQRPWEGPGLAARVRRGAAALLGRRRQAGEQGASARSESEPA